MYIYIYIYGSLGVTASTPGHQWVLSARSAPRGWRWGPADVAVGSPPGPLWRWHASGRGGRPRDPKDQPEDHPRCRREQYQKRNGNFLTVKLGNVFLSLKGPCKMLVNQRDQSPRKHHVSFCRLLHEIVKLSWRHKFFHLSQYDKILFHHVLVRCQHRILRKPWLRQLHQVGWIPRPRRWQILFFRYP